MNVLRNMAKFKVRIWPPNYTLTLDLKSHPLAWIMVNPQ